MNRRNFLRLAAAGPLRAAPSGRPNILFIQTDDQRADAVGYANPLVQTPNIDRVAARGVRFRNNFVVTSVCSASRAAVFTGRYGSVNGVRGLGGGLNPDETTFVAGLKQAGYYMGHIGKWHLTNPATPSAAGFDEDLHFISNGPHFNRKVIERGKPIVAEGFIEDFLAQRAVTFLERAAKQKDPFFLTLATQVPHMDHNNEWLPREETLARYRNAYVPMPASWQDKLDGKPPYLRSERHYERGRQFGYDDPDKLRAHIRRYWASITDLDASLAMVFNAIEKLGLRDNTYVVLTGDNGWFLGEHGFSSKVLPYEESIRVPLLIAGPRVSPREETAPVLNLDLAPTFLDVAGAKIPQAMQGRSLVEAWDTPIRRPRESFVYESLVTTLGAWPLVALREQRWKYIQTLNPQEPSKIVFEELYDLRADPAEIVNRSSKAKATTEVGRLRKKLENMRRAIA